MVDDPFAGGLPINFGSRELDTVWIATLRKSSSRLPLIDNGYLIGRNLVFEERYAGGDNEKVPALIAELLALKVDVLVTVGTAVSLAARHATSTCRSSACGRFTDLAKGYVVTDPFSRYGEVNQTYRGHPFQRD